MGIAIKLDKSAQESAAAYYQLAKKMKKKSGGVDKAIEETRKKIRRAEKKSVVEQKKPVRVARKKEWYESFGWSFTNSKKLILMGKNAKQNDGLVAKHMDDEDVFFHCDIRGGAATLLKGGLEASDEEKEFAAILSVCFSKAWGKGFSQADTYYVKKEQLSKHASGGFVGAGGFAITGKRVWYRNTPLKLRVGIDERGAVGIGAPGAEWMEKSVFVVPGKMPKEEACKKIADLLGVDEAEVRSALPAGGTSVVQE